MYKTKFYIASVKNYDEPLQYHFTEVSGWGETLRAPDGSIIEIRLDKRAGGFWHVTEKTTGCSIFSKSFKTRAEALNALTPDLLQAIANELKKPGAIKVINSLSNLYKSRR